MTVYAVFRVKYNGQIQEWEVNPSSSCGSSGGYYARSFVKKEFCQLLNSQLEVYGGAWKAMGGARAKAKDCAVNYCAGMPTLASDESDPARWEGVSFGSAIPTEDGLNIDDEIFARRLPYYLVGAAIACAAVAVVAVGVIYRRRASSLEVALLEEEEEEPTL